MSALLVVCGGRKTPYTVVFFCCSWSAIGGHSSELGKPHRFPYRLSALPELFKRCAVLADMLHEFLNLNREEIIDRTRAKVANRPTPRATEVELENGVPVFLTQLIDMLQSPATELGAAAMGASAARHGDEMRRMGFTVGQIVHDYGGLCQAITELAVEKGASIGSAEFKILNGCLDDAVAFAVTEFSRQREQSIVNQGVEHLGILAHEMRNALNTAVLAFSALQSGVVGTNGSTSTVVLRSMARMRELLDRSFAEVRLKAGIQKRTQVLVSAIIEEVGIASAVEAVQRGLEFVVEHCPGQHSDPRRPTNPRVGLFEPDSKTRSSSPSPWATYR
jgi:hypothetical protein